jgi:putative SOS response-associated peptidase YedK
MCGRFTLTSADQETLIGGLPFDTFSETGIRFRPRYNVAPGQRSPIVYLENGKPVLVDALWGLGRSGSGLVVNARSETADRTALFREAFREGRCLVPADGFFEWRRERGVNQPYLFRREDGGLLLMAGLRRGGRFVVLTEESKEAVAEIHDRMPVLLEGERARGWLAQGMLVSAPGLKRTAVSARVNRIENDDPECLSPLAQSSFEFD